MGGRERIILSVTKSTIPKRRRERKQWISSETLKDVEIGDYSKLKASITKLISLNIEFMMRKFKKLLERTRINLQMNNVNG